MLLNKVGILHDVVAVLYRLNITLISTTIAGFETRRFSSDVHSGDDSIFFLFITFV